MEPFYLLLGLAGGAIMMAVPLSLIHHKEAGALYSELKEERRRSYRLKRRLDEATESKSWPKGSGTTRAKASRPASTSDPLTTTTVAAGLFSSSDSSDCGGSSSSSSSSDGGM